MDIFNNLWSIIKTIQFRDIVDILAIALLIFGLFKLIRETRAVQLFKGLLLLFVVYILASLFNLVMLSTLLRSFFEASVVIIAVIFQPEIRKALEQVGRTKNIRKYFRVFSKYGKSDEWELAVRKSIVDAADTSVLFSRSRTGALIVFERETMLSDIASTGTIVDATTSVALFGNIFFRYQPWNASPRGARHFGAKRRGSAHRERGNGRYFSCVRRQADARLHSRNAHQKAQRAAFGRR